MVTVHRVLAFLVARRWLYAPVDPSRRLVWSAGATLLAAVLALRASVTA